MGVGAHEELVPVDDAADHPAHVDEVEVVAREGPLGITILDFTDILVSFVCFLVSSKGMRLGRDVTISDLVAQRWVGSV
jgi:hypothetical protein